MGLGPSVGLKTQKGPTKYDKFLNGCTLFPPEAEICAGLAGNFRQQLATVKSRAKDMVWLTVFYFTASQLAGGGERGSRAYAPHTVTLPTWFRWREQGVGMRFLPYLWLVCVCTTAQVSEWGLFPLCTFQLYSESTITSKPSKFISTKTTFSAGFSDSLCSMQSFQRQSEIKR